MKMKIEIEHKGVTYQGETLTIADITIGYNKMNRFCWYVEFRDGLRFYYKTHYFEYPDAEIVQKFLKAADCNNISSCLGSQVVVLKTDWEIAGIASLDGRDICLFNEKIKGY